MWVHTSIFVVGRHRCAKSIREMSSLLDIPRAMIKWYFCKLEALRNQSNSRCGRHKVTELGCQVMMCQRCQRSADSITAEFQSSSGIKSQKKTNFVAWLSSSYKSNVSLCKFNVTLWAKTEQENKRLFYPCSKYSLLTLCVKYTS